MNGDAEIKKNNEGSKTSEPTRTPITNESTEEDTISVASAPEEVLRALEAAKAKSEENWDLFLRTRAEMDNIRRRAQLDVDNAQKYGVERLVKELLAIVDSLEKGLESASVHTGEATAWYKGTELTLKLLLDTLEKFGVRCIHPQGEAFNPACHEVLAAQASDEVEPNKVLFVVQKGFSLHDRLLRPARVIVASAMSPAAVSEET